MQTFLPYADFDRSAQALDNRRLGKQRVEAFQILRVITTPEPQRRAWKHHPAVLMWDGCGLSLAHYALACCRAWTGRGYKDTVAGRVLDLIAASPLLRVDRTPWWVRDERLHRSHRQALLWKWHHDVVTHGWADSRRCLTECGWGDPPAAYEYWWPVQLQKDVKLIIAQAPASA